MSNGNSDKISRDYLDSLLIETRYLNSVIPSTEFTLFGEKFASPIMSAALSYVDHFMYEGAKNALVKGVVDANAVFWYGAAPDEDIEGFVKAGARMIEVVKPYADIDLIHKKIEHAEDCGVIAVGIDIDHGFTDDGTADEIEGNTLKALTTSELTEICRTSKLPVIVKGVLSCYDANEVLTAGAEGLVLSHHRNRIEFAVPPLQVLPEISELVGGRVPVFADCMIQTGMDAFKALALGAAGVCIGRPLMAAIKNDPENGVRDYLLKANAELAKAMAFTGCSDLSKIDPGVIHFKR